MTFYVSSVTEIKNQELMCIINNHAGESKYKEQRCVCCGHYLLAYVLFGKELFVSV